MAEVDQFGPTRGGVRSEGFGDERREQLALVEVEGVAAEQSVLEPPAVAVLGAVQVHQHIAHDHLAGVVQSLA